MTRAFLFAVSAVLFAAGCGPSQAPVSSEAAAPASAIEIHDPWTAPTPGGVEVSAGYLEIANSASADDRVVGVSSPRAARVEIHEMSMDGGVMRMRAVEGGLSAPAGGRVALAPGGLHLMFFGVTQPFVEGESIPVTLTFANAGDIEVSLTVRRPAVGAHSEH